MLKTRIITALILASLVILTTIYFEPVWFLFVSSLFILVGIWEWFKLFLNRDMRDIYIIFLVFPILFILIIWPSISFILSASSIRIDFFQSSVIFYLFYLSVTFFWIIIAPSIIINYQKKLFTYHWSDLTIGPKGTLKNFFLGNCLLWGMWLTLVILLVKNPYILLFLFLIIWSADIAAYFSGKKYGKHSLADNISPAKTWEGMVGGLTMGILTAFLALHFFRDFLGIAMFQASPKKIILLTSATVIYSVIGDLFISIIKRETGKKDSGVLIPGHGGVLDRIDSLMAGSVAFMFFGTLLGIFDYVHHGL